MGLVGVVPCCGWEKCGHGLTSIPRESASEAFLDELELNRKPPAHLVGSSVFQSRPRVWKRLRHYGIQLFPMLIVGGGVTISMTKGMFLINSGLEWDGSRDELRPTSPGLHA